MQSRQSLALSRQVAIAIASAAFVASAACARDYPRVPAYAAAPSSFDARILAAHNYERVQRRLAPLLWDPVLAAGAASYAQYLAVTGTFQHSNRQARRGVGENLWMGTSRAFAPEQMIGNWASEKRWFYPGIFPNVSQRDWSAVAHYTQIIWPTTTRVGCAVSSARGRDVLVCRYAPAGNIDGRPVG